MTDDIKDKIETLKSAIDGVAEILRTVCDDASVDREAWATLKTALGQLECASGNITTAIAEPMEQ